MGKRREKLVSRSQTLPSSPSHSFSSSTSSDFEFTVSLSPRATTSSSLNPADHLFYKGQLLPLHLSPRLSMVRSLLLSSSSTTSTSSSSATAFRRDSTASSSNDSTTSCPSSSRPSSVSDDNINQIFSTNHHHHHHHQQQQQKQTKKNKFFSLSRFSSVFNKKNEEQVNTTTTSSSSVKRLSTSAKQVFKKYLKKVKPLYEKPPHKQEEKVAGTRSNIEPEKLEAKKESNSSGSSHSFSGNLTYPRRRRSCISSCPSSMRSSPSHSRVLSRNGFTSMGMMNTGRVGGMHDLNNLSMEDLQSAIQGAIAHCKNSLVQKKITVVSNEV